MALDPIPYVVADSAPASNAPSGAVPIDIYGIPDAVTPQASPTVNPAPTDATEVAGDLQDLVNALVAAGVLTA